MCNLTTAVLRGANAVLQNVTVTATDDSSNPAVMAGAIAGVIVLVCTGLSIAEAYKRYCAPAQVTPVGQRTVLASQLPPNVQHPTGAGIPTLQYVTV